MKQEQEKIVTLWINVVIMLAAMAMMIYFTSPNASRSTGQIGYAIIFIVYSLKVIANVSNLSEDDDD